MPPRPLALLAAVLWSCATPLLAADFAKPDAQTIAALAPTGQLRAAINLGNSVLAQQDAAGALQGVSVEMAKTLAAHLGVPLKLIVYQQAGTTFAAGVKGDWDVAFLAIDTERAKQVDFTAPYVVIDGAYVVWADSPFKTTADLDKDGVRIAAPKGSAYELYLSRTLKHATIIRSITPPDATKDFVDQHLEALAGVGAALRAAVKDHPTWRVMSPSFQTIRQAMATPKGRSPQAQAYVATFVEQMKTSGVVRKALDASGQTDADVAPTQNP